MIVVDSMRFPYIEAGNTGVPGTPDTVLTGGKDDQLYSYQRLQPYRGGHAVPSQAGTGIDTRYGYTEQVAVPATGSATGATALEGYFGSAYITSIPATTTGGTAGTIYHTIGYPNDGAFQAQTTTVSPPVQQEEWDYFPFNDRDFTSVFELTLVPGCPPGLFTKQFAEFAPSQTNATNIFQPAATTPLTTPPYVAAGTLPILTAYTNATNYFNILGATNPVQPHTFPYLVDKFFYTAAGATAATPSTVNDQTGDGWFKMFEVFDIPSQMIGSIGPVMQGINFDWLRQDTKPGLINPNLIIDEEVFFSVFGKQAVTPGGIVQQLMNFDQLPAPSWTGGSWGYPGTASQLPLAVGSSPVPIVVTSTLATGAPGSGYPMNNVGMVAPDPLSTVNPINNQMKVAFAQFLTLRHGGSGYVFGYGSGLPGQNFSVALGTANPNEPVPPTAVPADRPFHSLSYPDIDYTVLRPAALPPSQYTDPVQNLAPTAGPPPQLYAGDPGVKNPLAYPGYTTGPITATNLGPTSTMTTPTWVPGPTTLRLPPAIPLRRLFQIPDAYSVIPGGPYSNAGEQGDSSLNNLTPTAVTTNPATGALPPFNASVGPVNANNSVATIFWPGANTPAPYTNPYLGFSTLAVPPVTNTDDRQHPYFRSEQLQKAVNLTTSRTHQYAVWITVGFFEVRRQGDLLMAAAGAGTQAATLAYDILGPEIGASTGATTRYRSFFIVDRLKLTAYDPNVIGSFRPAVVYRQAIE
jgi:hypothetical protein